MFLNYIVFVNYIIQSHLVEIWCSDIVPISKYSHNISKYVEA